MRTLPAREGEATRDPGGGRRLYLLRHGQAAPAATQAGVADPWLATLTAYGATQIEELAEILAGCRLDMLVTSAVPRALETAAILACRNGLRPAVDEGWNELRAGQVLAGPADQVRRTVREAYREAGRPGARFLGGETFADFARRVEDAVDRLLMQPGWTRAAVVTHEPALSHVLSLCHRLGLGGLGRFELTTGSASVVELAPGARCVDGATVRLLNGTGSDLRLLG